MLWADSIFLFDQARDLLNSLYRLSSYYYYYEFGASLDTNPLMRSLYSRALSPMCFYLVVPYRILETSYNRAVQLRADGITDPESDIFDPLRD